MTIDSNEVFLHCCLREAWTHVPQCTWSARYPQCQYTTYINRETSGKIVIHRTRIQHTHQNIAFLSELSLQENSWQKWSQGSQYEFSTSYMSYLWAWKHRISLWVLIAGELIWRYEKHFFIRDYEKLIWKSFMKKHMRTWEFVYSWCAMRNHALDKLIWGHEKPTFSREDLRTHMEIIHEKTYEDMRICLLVVRNEKSCPGELIWGHKKPNFSREGMRGYIEIVFHEGYEKSCPSRNFSKFLKVTTFF